MPADRSRSAIPTPARDRWPLAAGLGAVVTGAAVLGFALGGLLSGEQPTAVAAAQPPPVPLAVVPSAASAAPVAVSAEPGAPATAPRQAKLDELRFARNDRHHVRAGWVAGFYELYEIAARAHGVNWLLIASVHKQETGFSTNSTTYRGLNFARCCAGPMQFNVTNGPTTTWERYRHSYRAAQRPARYPHRSARHPSVYDDFDAIMAAAALLRDSGAGQVLDATAWRAAFDYYGHDLVGVDYANQVLARAIGWGQRRRFCVNCLTDAGLIASIDAAWGAPVRDAMTTPQPEAPKPSERGRVANR